MKYENAGCILPETLFQEVQKYAAGKLLYVPDVEEKKPWGEISGFRKVLMKRNQMICNMFLYGVVIEDLALEFNLSIETIKKIVYSRKNNLLEYQPTVKSAREYSYQGMLEEWIHTYLLFERRNKVFSDGLKSFYRYYIGPTAMPLNLFHRSSGPEPEMKWQVHPEVFAGKVSAWVEALRDGKDVPPLIVNYADGGFEINSDNPLFEAMKQIGKEEHDIIFWITEEADYEQFVDRYHLL